MKHKDTGVVPFNMEMDWMLTEKKGEAVIKVGYFFIETTSRALEHSLRGI